jgi:hypothetical protein
MFFWRVLVPKIYLMQAAQATLPCILRKAPFRRLSNNAGALHVPTTADVEQAAARLRGKVQKTPLLESLSLNALVGEGPFTLAYPSL